VSRYTQGQAICHLGAGLPVDALLAELAANPQVWDEHTSRTAPANSPHHGLSDIWVRYNDWANFTGDSKAFNEEHDAVWLPPADVLPSAKRLAKTVMGIVGGDRLGMVLITRIPPGGRVAPHVDAGWHARYYDKYAVQIKGNADQAFHFEGESLSAEPGDLYAFDNSKLHWVTNDSDEERITCIICIRGRHD
jgi:hypothetical protein